MGRVSPPPTSWAAARPVLAHHPPLRRVGPPPATWARVLHRASRSTCGGVCVASHLSHRVCVASRLSFKMRKAIARVCEGRFGGRAARPLKQAPRLHWDVLCVVCCVLSVVSCGEGTPACNGASCAQGALCVWAVGAGCEGRGGCGEGCPLCVEGGVGKGTPLAWKGVWRRAPPSASDAAQGQAHAKGRPAVSPIHITCVCVCMCVCVHNV